MQISKQKYKTLVSDMRLDAEAYMPIYIEIEKILKCKKYTTLGEEVKSYKKGIFDINAECYCDANSPNAVPFVRILNLKNMVIDTTDIAYIPFNEHKKNINTSLLKNDLILSKTAIPACSLVTVRECNTSQDTIAVKLKSNSSLKSPFLVVFLNSCYGKNQMKRWFTGNIQMHLNLTDSKTIIIPILIEVFQSFITKIFEESLTLINKSNLLYTESKNILLSELGLMNWLPKNKLYSIKKYSEVENSSRIDAEYFQPKYDKIIDKIKNYSGGWNTFKSIVNTNDKNVVPKDNIEYGYIELSNISNNGEITEYTKDLGKHLPTRARRIVKTNDVILSSIEGSLGSIALITKQYNNCFCSNGFYVINSEYYNSETLLCLMKSAIGQLQLKKGCSGTILTAISKEELNKIILPKIKIETQNIIKEKIQLMYKLKENSKQLLEIAKKGVEIAIEQNEDIATSWINEQLSKIEVEL